MNANRVMKLFRLAALAAFLLCLGSTGAKAQDGFTGKFTLPFTAHWGSTVLPAGDYTVRLVATQTNERVLEIRSVAKSAIVLTAVADTKVTSDHSELILELINGAYFVRKFAVLELGVTFVYPVPKA